MKKNFFKKLAFVLALALVVTSVAPSMAANAAAAKAPAWSNLTGSKKTLYVGKKFDINVKNKPSAKSTYTWTSSSKTVATVNKSGVVTAKKAGKATIKVVIKNAKTKKTTKTLNATFTVKESATKVVISNPTKEVAVGANVYDFNRTLTTKSGGPSTDKTYWVITDDTAGTTVASNGAITTTKTGEFKIQAVTATSQANFKAGKTTAVSEVLTVKVPVAIKTVKQLAANKVDVTFNTNVKDLVKATDFAIENVASHATQAIKGISFSADGTVVTVESYLVYTDAKEYKVVYAGKENKFTASVGDVDSVVIKTSQIPFGKATKVEYSLFDKNGVDVTSTVDASKSIETTVETTGGYLDSEGKLTLSAKGNTAKVTVTFKSGKYENGAELTKKAEAVITAVDPKDITVGDYEKYTITNKTINWAKVDKTNAQVAIGDNGYKIYVKAKNSNNEDVNADDIKYVSSNNDVVLVTEKGVLTPVKEGSAYIIATVGKTSWTLPVTVVAERKVNLISIKDNKTSLTLSNTHKVEDKATIEVVLKDQYGDDWSKAYTAKVDSVAAQSEVNGVPEPTNPKAVSFTTNRTSVAKTGDYNFKVSAEGKTVIITVKVVAPSNVDAVYQLQLSTQTVDTALAADTNLSSKDVTIKVAALKGNALDDYVAVDSYSIVKTSSNVEVASASAIDNIDKNGFAFKTVSGSSIIKKVETGTYKVNVTILSNGSKVTLPAYINVTDTQAKATVAVDSLTATTSNGSVLKLAQNALKAKDADGNDITANNIAKVFFKSVKGNGNTDSDISTLTAGDTVYIEKVIVNVVVKDANGNVVYTIPQEVTIGRTITVK